MLRDGAPVHFRPIRPDDAPRIEALHQRLSAETIYFRFFSPLSTLPSKLLQRLVNVDYRDRLALVAELGDQLVAVARYERVPSSDPGGAEAEVAFLVDDAHQGRGLGTVLLEHLVGAAQEAGITRFVADTLPENRRMLRVFHEAGFDDERHFADGVIRVAFPIEPTEASLAATYQRERHAAARSVHRLLHPRSVAVIGASRREATLGHMLLTKLIQSRFNGPVYPVNPDALHVGSVRAYHSVLEIPDPVDLAVVVVPAAAVPAVVEECAQKHVVGLVVISSGFSESSPEGATAERAVVAEARRHGMRVIGPNSMGAVNTDPEVRLNATFSPAPPAGRIGFISQSGALGVVILDELARRGLGISTFVSAGNKADLSSNDLLQYWGDDPATDVCLMYIESFGNPRVFARVARRVAGRKPIVAVKSARSLAGVRAVGPHREVEDDRMVDALFRQAGVIRTDTLEELFDVAQLLDSQPLPAGTGVAIVGNSGGPGVLAADACSAAGLEMAVLSATTREQISGPSTGRTRTGNPVSLAPDATPEAFRHAIQCVLADPAVHAVIAVYTSPVPAPLDEVTEAVVSAQATQSAKPVLACVLGERGLLRARGGAPIPSYAFPEAAARALGHVSRYAEWRRRPVGTAPKLSGIDSEAGRELAAGALQQGDGTGGWMAPPQLATLLDRFGLAVVPSTEVDNEEAAVAAAERLGYPVAVKRPVGADRVGPGRGGFRLDLGDAAAVRSACAELAPADHRVQIQAMTAPGDHVVVGITHNPVFGPLVTLGVGGRLGERPQPGSGRATPVTDIDAIDLTSSALGPTRPDGETWTPGQRAAITDIVMRVGRMADDVPELSELELNPVIVSSAHAVVVGARARLVPVEPHPELALRRL